ncbi:hypothetical protein M231_01257 [Tremella mesenterica]|uniref:Glucose-methanol-choline oxidoreductase N-terminal domain-containing protein n=1 Tax=Tremella mesenterica TaxID=5217 RepID=A0A4Q1BTS1_TREME|nr:hypothetical protein M231_01257 [Tremella mesenterica]
MRTIFLLEILVLSASNAWALSGIITDPNQVNGQSFDYVIVGGGLGGLVVANRLSEDSSITVLVIEAGGDDRTNNKVYDPYQYSAAFSTPLNWAWPSSQGRTINGGKTLGGSTSINGLAQTRAQKDQYDALATLLNGDDADGKWTWDGMFAAMLKSEGFSGPNDNQQAAGASQNPAYHSTTGPLQVTYPDDIYQGPHQKYFKQVISTNFSVPASVDADGGDAAVVAFHPNTIDWHDSDHRSSSATAYWSPIEGQRENIAILINQQATKILFNSGTPVHATGVQFGTSDGSRYEVDANREVIVSAGAIQSPALLQLSGIGDQGLLQSVGIDVVLDLPGVGKNLQEQTLDSIGWTLIDGFNPDGRGPSDCIAYPNLDALFGSNASAIANTIDNNLQSYADDAAQAGAVISSDAAMSIFRIQQDLMVNKGVGLAEMFFDTGFPNGGLGVDMWQLLPFSRGTVSITSTDPFTYPAVDPRYFAADIDMQIQVAGLRLSRKVFQAAPLRSIVTSENAPGFNTVSDDSDGGPEDQWRQWILDGFASVHHPIATCSMMAQEYGGVVGSDLKVYGTDNLRVVDASVLPMQISAHLAASLYGLAENAADM